MGPCADTGGGRGVGGRGGDGWAADECNSSPSWRAALREDIVPLGTMAAGEGAAGAAPEGEKVVWTRADGTEVPGYAFGEGTIRRKGREREFVCNANVVLGVLCMCSWLAGGHLHAGVLGRGFRGQGACARRSLMARPRWGKGKAMIPAPPTHRGAAQG